MSDRIVNSFSVSYRYPVLFTHDAFARTNPVFAEVLAEVCSARVMPCLALVDEGLAAAAPSIVPRLRQYLTDHAATVALRGDPLVVPGGEAAKAGWAVPGQTLATATRAGLCRHSVVIAVGGGAMLDAVGLGVALFHRGARLIRCPTTVLAQCDSGVGVKNGINLDGTKNLAGVFSPPAAVVNDVETLRTLSDRDWRSGLAEAFKVAAIQDAEFLVWLETHAEPLRERDMAAMEWLVKRCAGLHCRHIVSGGDPFESGNTRPLDFGHWSAHRIEALSGFSLRHGEAVAVGVALDLLYASRQGFVGRAEAETVIRAMAACGLPVWDETLAYSAADGTPAVLEGIEEFRRHLGGELHLTLPAPLGQSCEVTCLDRTLLAEAIRELRALAAGVDGGRLP